VPVADPAPSTHRRIAAPSRRETAPLRRPFAASHHAPRPPAGLRAIHERRTL